MHNFQPDFNNYDRLKSKRNMKRLILISLAVIAFSYFIFNLKIFSNEFVANGNDIPWIKRVAGLFAFSFNSAQEADPNYVLPPKDNNRLNILILGIEGQDDVNSDIGGPLLTDSIEVFSYDKTTRRASLISVPRDLLVLVHDGKKDKLNTVYEYGYYHSSNPLRFVENRVSEITGVYIDNAVIFDFASFKKVIDTLGGIDVMLDKPFSETQQWGYPFSLPAGINHLNGQSALYYARSRYSSNDFDRSRRQQQIIFAIKDKVLKMNIFSDPIRALSLVKDFSTDIRTDFGLWDIKDLIEIGKRIDTSPAMFKRYVISTDNLVSQSRAEDGAFILLPKVASTSYGQPLAKDFDAIKALFGDILK